MSEDNIFSGLKVVDLSSFIAGPGAATILSDFGADVVKVEPPEGELWRKGQKIPPQPRSEEPYPFQLSNRNKRGVALNLKAASAQQVLERLAKWADVFIVNTPHSARKKLNLEYEDVARWNPRLIYADLTGFGEKGPDAALAGFDLFPSAVHLPQHSFVVPCHSGISGVGLDPLTEACQMVRSPTTTLVPLCEISSVSI